MNYNPHLGIFREPLKLKSLHQVTQPEKAYRSKVERIRTRSEMLEDFFIIIILFIFYYFGLKPFLVLLFWKNYLYTQHHLTYFLFFLLLKNISKLPIFHPKSKCAVILLLSTAITYPLVYSLLQSLLFSLP